MKAFEFVAPFKVGSLVKLAFISDMHKDSPDCDVERLKRDLNWCKAEGRYIIIDGDLYDAILLKDMKRSVNHLMEQGDNQLNIKINNVVEFLRPYQENILFIGRGNHEESILKHSGIDIIQMTVDLLNAGSKHKIQYGNYANFLRFNFVDARKKSVAHYDVFEHHGAGGSAPATKGMLDFNAIAKGVNADLIVIGHKHNAIADFSTPIMYVNQSGEVVLKNRQCIQTPSYQKGRTIDYNLNFAERFYGHQALSGFASVNLMPYYDENGKPRIDSDVKMTVRPNINLGKAVATKLYQTRQELTR